LPSGEQGRVARSGDDLLPGKGGEIVAELGAHQHVRQGTELHAPAGAEDHLPHVVRGEGGDLRNRLRIRFRAGDDVLLPARASFQERPPTVLARPEVEQQIAGQRVGVPLDIGFDAGGIEERVAVMVKVLKLGGHVAGKLIAQDDTGREAVPNARLGVPRGGIDGSIAVETVPDIRSDLILLPESGGGEQG